MAPSPRRIRHAVTRAAAVETLESRRLLSAGFPDGIFGNTPDGFFYTGTGLPGRVTQSVIDATGNIYYLSLSRVSPGQGDAFQPLGEALAITKITPQGDVDTNWAQSGRFTFTLAGGIDEALSLHLTPDDELVFVATAFTDAGGVTVDTVIGRVDATGSLTSHFGSGGFLFVDLETYFGGTTSTSAENVERTALAPGNQLVLYRRLGGSALFKLDLNTAEPVSTFGTGGRVDANPGFTGVSSVGSLAVDDQGRIYQSARNPNGGTIFRRNPDGTLDANFRPDGGTFYPDVLAADPEVVVTPLGAWMTYRSGFFNVDGAGVRLFDLDQGNLITTFGDGGFELVALADASSVVPYARPDGRIIVAVQGPSQSNATEFKAARFDELTRDPTFGAQGLISIPLPEFLTALTGVIRSDDTFVLIPTPFGGEFATNYLTAYDTQGQIDTTFAANGQTPGTLFAVPVKGGPAEVRAIARVSSGYLALQSELVDNEFVLTYAMRLGPDGELVQRTLIEPEGVFGSFTARRAFLLPTGNGRVYAVLAGNTFGRTALARFTSTGALDLTFGTNGLTPIQISGDLRGQSAEITGAALSDDESQILLATPLLQSVLAINLDGTVPAEPLLGFGDDAPVAVLAEPGQGLTVALQRTVSFVQSVVIRSVDSSGNNLPDFNGGNELALNLPDGARPITIHRLGSGRIAVGGTIVDTEPVNGRIRYRYFVALLDSTGTLVQSFGNNGIVLNPGGQQVNRTQINAISEDGIGGYLIAGSFNGTGIVFRLTANGTLDGNYGPARGSSSTSVFDRITGVILDGENRAIVSGWRTRAGVAHREAYVARLGAAELPRPIASFSPPDQPAADATSFEFVVTYFSPAGQTIDPQTLGDSDVIVELEGPGGTLTPIGTVSFLSFQELGGQLLATYRLNAPAGGFPSGLFRFRLVAGEVADSAGSTNLAQQLGSRTYTFSSAVLSVTAVAVTAPGPFVAGSALPVRVLVGNTGTLLQPAGATVTLLLVLGGGAEVTLGTATLPEIPAGGSATLDVPGLVIPVGISGTHRVRAEAGESSLLSASFEIFPPVPRVGEFDPTFGGGDGVAVTVLPGPTITTTTTLSLPGGRLLSVGFNTAGNITLVRTTAGGTPDVSFGTSGDGRVVLDLRGTFDVATAAVLDADGHYVVTGYSLDPSGGGASVFVLRVLTSGVPDESFGTGGVLIVTVDVLAGAVTTPRVLAVGPGGSLLVAGSTRPAEATESGNRAVVLRVTPGGALDTTYGTGGVVLPTISAAGGRSEISAGLVLPDGKLLLGGTAAEGESDPLRFLLLRLDTAGQFDLRFGRRGVLLVPSGGAGQADRVTTLTLTPDRLGPRGSVYAGGVRGSADGSSSSAVLFRINARGAVDRAFARGLAVVLGPGGPGAGSVSTVSGVVVQAEGRVLASVTTAASAAAFQAGRFGVVLVRLDVRGRTDALFNQGQPLVVAAVPPEPSAAQPGVGSFEDFSQSRQGQAAEIEGGRVRSVATRPTQGGTELSVAGIVPDGVDLSGTLVAARLGPQVAPGFRTTAQLSLSNIGSLASRGAFSVVLVARPVDGGDEVVLRTLNRGGSVRAGATVRVNLPVALARTIATGEYTLLARLTSTFEELSIANNTAVREPNFVVQ